MEWGHAVAVTTSDRQVPPASDQEGRQGLERGLVLAVIRTDWDRGRVQASHVKPHPRPRCGPDAAM